MVKEQFSAKLVHPHPLLYYPGEVAPNIIPTTNRRGPGNMRKYYQATLVAIALVSVVCLLFYRHEYNKLRYVIEVINFFGKPGTTNTGGDPNCLKGNNEINKLELRFDAPLPSWQRLNNDLFIYSAFHVNQNEITTIAFGKAIDDLNLNCKVFFEGTEPTIGSFRYMKISASTKIFPQQSLEYTGYHLLCKYSELGIPEGVSFFSKEDDYESKSHFINIKDSSQSLKSNEMAICVAPSLNRSISHLDLLSFVNFHQVIGVTHFIIYNYDVPNTFTEAVRDIINSRGLNFTFTIVPWNFPFNEISRDIVKRIIEADCIHRTYNQVGYSAVLYWEEYMVLKYHHTVLELLTDIEKSLLSSDSYRLDTSVFCTQQADDEKIIDPAPMIFKKLDKFSEDKAKSSYVYIHKPHKNLNLERTNTVNAGQDLINVNRYRYCSNSENKLSYAEDRSILRFAENMLDSPIYKQYVVRQNSPTK